MELYTTNIFFCQRQYLLRNQYKFELLLFLTSKFSHNVIIPRASHFKAQPCHLPTLIILPQPVTSSHRVAIATAEAQCRAAAITAQAAQNAASGLSPDVNPPSETPAPTSSTISLPTLNFYRPRLRPKPSPSRPRPTGTARASLLRGPSLRKPSLSRGFQAEPSRHITILD